MERSLWDEKIRIQGPKPWEGRCPICDDIGLVQYPDGIWDACECQVRLRTWRRVQNMGLGDEIERLTFDSFEASTPWLRAIRDAAKGYAEYIKSKPKRPGWYVMLGQSGSGKTHLCTAIFRELMNAGFDIGYISWRKFILKAKKRFDEEEGAENERLVEQYSTMPLLYIDDLFKGTTSPADASLAFELLNDRLIRDLPTIISSEMERESLIKLDEATAGRIIERAKRGGQMIIIPKDQKLNYRLRE